MASNPLNIRQAKRKPAEKPSSNPKVNAATKGTSINSGSPAPKPTPVNTPRGGQTNTTIFEDGKVTARSGGLSPVESAKPEGFGKGAGTGAGPWQAGNDLNAQRPVGFGKGATPTPSIYDDVVKTIVKQEGPEGLAKVLGSAFKWGGPRLLKAALIGAGVVTGAAVEAAMLALSPNIGRNVDPNRDLPADAQLPPANMDASSNDIIPPEAPRPDEAMQGPMAQTQGPMQPVQGPMQPVQGPMQPVQGLPVPVQTQVPPQATSALPPGVSLLGGPPQGPPQAPPVARPNPSLLAPTPTPTSASMANPANAPSTPMVNKGNRAAQVAVQEDFRNAFKNARAKSMSGGPSTFEWPQGSGKIYTTKLKGE